MTYFEMQVKVERPNGDREWKSVHATGSNVPYQYAQRDEAMRMLRQCYPDQIYGEDVRLLEVD